MLVKSTGCRYNKPEHGEPIVEYHVDSRDLIQKQMNLKTAFVGNRSVRYQVGRNLLIWGHNKAKKQYLNTKKAVVVQMERQD